MPEIAVSRSLFRGASIAQIRSKINVSIVQRGHWQLDPAYT